MQPTRILENFSYPASTPAQCLGKYCEAIKVQKATGDKSQHYRCVAMFSVKMLIRFEGAHVFYVSVFGGVEHLRISKRRSRDAAGRRSGPGRIPTVPKGGQLNQ